MIMHVHKQCNLPASTSRNL